MSDARPVTPLTMTPEQEAKLRDHATAPWDGMVVRSIAAELRLVIAEIDALRLKLESAERERDEARKEYARIVEVNRELQASARGSESDYVEALVSAAARDARILRLVEAIRNAAFSMAEQEVRGAEDIHDALLAALADAAPGDALRDVLMQCVSECAQTMRSTCSCGHCDEMMPGWSAAAIVQRLLGPEPTPSTGDDGRGNG